MSKSNVLEQYYAETAKKWRPATAEEQAALRAAALDPSNRLKMTRFNEPPTVQQVLDALSELPRDAKVLVTDHEGNYVGALFDISRAYPLSKFRFCNEPAKVASDAVVVTLFPAEA